MLAEKRNLGRLGTSYLCRAQWIYFIRCPMFLRSAGSGKETSPSLTPQSVSQQANTISKTCRGVLLGCPKSKITFRSSGQVHEDFCVVFSCFVFSLHLPFSAFRRRLVGSLSSNSFHIFWLQAWMLVILFQCITR